MIHYCYNASKELTTEKEILIYLNGYFRGLSELNSFCDDGLTAYATSIQIQENEELIDTIERHLGTKEYAINFKNLLSVDHTIEKITKQHFEYF